MDEEFEEVNEPESGSTSQDKPSFIEKQRAKNKENVDSNEEALRAAATVLKDKGIPYASAIAAGVDAADKISGGRTTRALGHAMNLASKVPTLPGAGGVVTPKRLQRMTNMMHKSGATKAINNFAGAKSGGKGGSGKSLPPKSSNSNDNKFEIKIPTQAKLAIVVVVIAALAIMGLVFFVSVLVDGENSGAGMSGGNFTYGKTCTTVTVTDTGCDSNGNNCTYEYDGEVSLENYVAGVVAAKATGANNLEYYKTEAVVARTYYLENTNDDCTVSGNHTFQPYMNVENSADATLIKQAVEETKGLVLTEEDNLSDVLPSTACVINADENYYYVRYGKNTSSEAQIQSIPRSFDQEETMYKGYLSNAYSTVDQSNTDYQNKACPTNENDYGMSQLGAYYLTTKENYTYDQVISYYYGENVKVTENPMQLNGVNGYVNPTRSIYCSSPYGTRIHPVTNVQKFHSGIDIAIAGGEPIYAVKDGTIVSVRNDVNAINNCNYGYGNYISIDHGDGTITLYAHMKYGSIPNSLTSGTQVTQGTQIGEVGSTGCSTGNHLHYEVSVNGSTVDPADYLNLTNASGECKR